MGLPHCLEAPVFFTSASKVKIPFVGDDTRAVKLADTRFYPILNPLEKHHDQVSKHFVRIVSNNVRFEDGVIRDRCSHALPFKSHDFSELFSPDFVLPREATKNKEYAGRFDTRQYIRKPPCHLKKLCYPHIFREHSNNVLEEKTERHHLPILEDVGKHMKKQTSSDDMLGQTEQSDLLSLIPVKDWDKSVVDKLGKDTSHWIVYEALSPGTQKEKLEKFLREKYGEKISNTHIIRADVSENDLQKLRKNKQEELNKEREINRKQSTEQKLHAIREDQQFKKSLAEYYKLPWFLSRQRSNVINSSNEVNQTAQDIVVKHLQHSPPPNMEDFLNQAAGKYINRTDNEYEQQLYTGQAKPVHQKSGDRSRVIMDDLSEYKVDIRPRYPLNPNHWSTSEGTDKSVKGEFELARGLRRWTKLPQPADFMSERGPNPPKTEETPIENLHYNKMASMVSKKPLITLVEEWRQNWKLVGQWQDIPIAEIMIDMDSPHDHIRLGAVAACAMASLHKKPVNDIAGLAPIPKKEVPELSSTMSEGHLPEVLVNRVREKILDKNGRVRLAAAMCLYSLGFYDEDIIDILKSNLKGGYGCDRLAAAQCLALSNGVSANVISMMVQLLLEKSDAPLSALSASQKEQATTLLVHVSNTTSLVHSLLAEQLNSSSWKDRVIACQVLGRLVGCINEDLVHKLTNLMWHDWSTEVRKAAAETLGRTGHGRDIHYELRKKLCQGNEAVRTSALKKISHLGIMTAALLPVFMACFSDQYVSVRLQSCMTAGKLRLCEEAVGKELLRLTEFDPSWKIKAHAIKALREIGFFSKNVSEALLWALRFEDQARVRMQACLALRNLYQRDALDDSVLRIFQDRALVEPDPVVREEVHKTLKAFDAEYYDDNMDMIRRIKTEVKRLCNKSIIAAKIAMYERELDKYQNKVQYLGFDSVETRSCSSSTSLEAKANLGMAAASSNRPSVVSPP